MLLGTVQDESRDMILLVAEHKLRHGYSPHRQSGQGNGFPRAKLGTAYRHWPHHTEGATSRAQHLRYAVPSLARGKPL